MWSHIVIPSKECGTERGVGKHNYVGNPGKHYFSQVRCCVIALIYNEFYRKVRQWKSKKEFTFLVGNFTEICSTFQIITSLIIAPLLFLYTNITYFQSEFVAVILMWL